MPAYWLFKLERCRASSKVKRAIFQKVSSSCFQSQERLVVWLQYDILPFFFPLCSIGRSQGFDSWPLHCHVMSLGKLFTFVPLSTSSNNLVQWCPVIGKVTLNLGASNVSLPPSPLRPQSIIKSSLCRLPRGCGTSAHLDYVTTFTF